MRQGNEERREEGRGKREKGRKEEGRLRKGRGGEWRGGQWGGRHGLNVCFKGRSKPQQCCKISVCSKRF